MAKMTAEDRRFTAKLVSLIMTGVLVLVALLMYFNLAFGWFAQNEEVGGNGASVQSHGNINPNVHAWRFDLTGGETGEDFDKSGSWVDALDAETEDPNDLLPVVLSQEGDTVNTEKYTFLSLHLGTVDNLLDLSDDNCFYIRIDMTADVIGNRGASVSLRHDIVGMDFYASTGEKVAQEDIADSYDSLRGLVDIDCAVSATAYDMTDAAGATAVKALFNTRSESGVLTPDKNCVEIERGDAGVPVYESSDNTPYYVYLRMRPDLETCFDATHDISHYMPCQILFNMEIELGFAQ